MGYIAFFLSLLSYLGPLAGDWPLPISLEPVAVIVNPSTQYTLINSVDFHPKENLFCCSYTQLHQVALYRLDSDGQPTLVQTLQNPEARLNNPQHSAFSPDGQQLVVANWKDLTVAFYHRLEDGSYSKEPVRRLDLSSMLTRHKPHGVSFSPCGKFLTIAYGVGYNEGKAIALLSLADDGSYELVDILEALPGIPKGVVITPDSTELLVTFADIDAVVHFALDQTAKKIYPTHKILQGTQAAIRLPEDVKISPDARHIAVSNSAGNTVTFYPFDSSLNAITQDTPCYILQDSDMIFPHGITYSPDGSFFVVSQFGPLHIAADGNIHWRNVAANKAQIRIFRLQK